jgi:ElaB/YqjD/DUF883 family membrane-anchored ribosome-binding protein
MSAHQDEPVIRAETERVVIVSRAASADDSTVSAHAWAEEPADAAARSKLADQHGEQQEDDSSPETEQIRQDIEHTREEMSQTIDAIQDRLSPQRLVHEAQETVRDATVGRIETMVSNVGDRASDMAEAARDLPESFVDRVRANPLPAALIGIGLGWMFMRGNEDRGSARRSRGYSAGTTAYARYGAPSRGYYPETYHGGYALDEAESGYYERDRESGGVAGQARAKAGEVLEDASDRASEVMSNVTDRASDMVHNARGMMGDVADTTMYRARGAGRTVFDTIRDNPLPSALAALSLGWLFMNNSTRSRDHHEYDVYGDYRGRYDYDTDYGAGHGSGYGYGTTYAAYSRPDYDDGGFRSRMGDAADQAREKVGDAADQARAKVGDAADQARQRVGDVAEQARDRVSGLTDEAEYRFRWAEGEVERFVQQNPLAAGAIALAAGAAVSMLLPRTEQENELLGGVRDKVMERAQTVVGDASEKVQRVVEEAQHTVKQEAQAQGLTS